MKQQPIETLLWSIAFPGFGQILNGHFIKGIVFIFLEFIVNVNAKLNLNIKYSFQGDFAKAVQVTNYEWIMFYPCLYVFAMYDSYINALHLTGQKQKPFLAVPFASAAYLSTIGVIYSDNPMLYKYIPPIFIPIVGLLLGFVCGTLIRRYILHFSS